MSTDRLRRAAPLVLGLCLAGGEGASQPTPAAASARPFALVELFTSEGCSSCPPADVALADIDAEARRTGAEVYALSFHVDYWNDLGWPDPFSDAANTRRQQAYARVLGGGTYTPEAVVNGAEGFVGGDRSRLRRAVDAALARRSGVALVIELGRRADEVTARYRVTGAPPGSEVSVAWVERLREVDVRRGENAGRRLRHANVVRAWASLPLGAEGTGVQTLRVPPGASAGEVVAWVRAPTMRVLAAARAASASST